MSCALSASVPDNLLKSGESVQSGGVLIKIIPNVEMKDSNRSSTVLPVEC